MTDDDLARLKMLEDKLGRETAALEQSVTAMREAKAVLIQLRRYNLSIAEINFGVAMLANCANQVGHQESAAQRGDALTSILRAVYRLDPNAKA